MYATVISTSDVIVDAIMQEPKREDTPTPILVPEKLHCFHCKSKQPLVAVCVKDTFFTSKFKGILMNRPAWVATCQTCGKLVRSFKKGDGPVRPKTKKEKKEKKEVKTELVVKLSEDATGEEVKELLATKKRKSPKSKSAKTDKAALPIPLKSKSKRNRKQKQKQQTEQTGQPEPAADVSQSVSLKVSDPIPIPVDPQDQTATPAPKQQKAPRVRKAKQPQGKPVSDC